MARTLRVTLVWCTLAAMMYLWLGDASAKPWPEPEPDPLLEGVWNYGKDTVKNATYNKVKEMFFGRPETYARYLVNTATQLVGHLTGELVGGLLEVIGMNGTCYAESAMGCRRVVSTLIQEYLDVSNVPLNPWDLYKALRMRILVHPGTKWCGAKSVAHNDSEDGVLAATDVCCLRHANCPEKLAPGETRYGLHNTGKYYRYSCECDREFYKCLRIVNTLVSLKIGVTYFNIMRPQCYKKTYPASCKIRPWWFFKSLPCSEYELDPIGAPSWQWFDNPIY